MGNDARKAALRASKRFHEWGGNWEIGLRGISRPDSRAGVELQAGEIALQPKGVVLNRAIYAAGAYY